MDQQMRDIESIKKAVGDTFAREFDRVRILEIRFHEDSDADGDDILRIEVIFEGTSKDLDPRKLSGFVRHLRPRLEKLHESALPLLSFISGAEMKPSKRASA